MPLDPPGPVRQAEPHRTVQILLPDGRAFEGPRGSALSLLISPLAGEGAPIVGGIVNAELRELSYTLELDSRVRPVTMGDVDGMRIYRRSLTFLLAAAFEALFPGSRLTVDHSVSSGGYYCQVADRAPLAEEELKLLDTRMRELVAADLPIVKESVPIQEAIASFAAKGNRDKERLLAHRRKSHLVFYRLGELRDYHFGYKVPSTGYLKWFALARSGDGFTLRFPRRHRPTELLPLPEYPKLLATFREYGAWLEALGIAGTGALNDALQAGRGREIVLVSEALHESRISEIAAEIDRHRETTRLILVAGPSASGKTTFAKRLSVQLLARGISPVPVELDSFFVDREKTPRDESGEYDYESLEALDRERMNHDLARLIRGEEVRLPRYDFVAGRQVEGPTVRLGPGQIVILEGIHGLNPDLLPDVPRGRAFRIYVSALTQLNLDRYNRVSTTDTRLLRRIVRDATQRGHNAADTIHRWESVRRGEKRYIYPFQENADLLFNSALVYECSALAPLAEPLLRQVPFGTAEHIEAKRLLAFLEWFLPVETELIPDNSILREFLGGSSLRDFRPWPG